MLKKRSATLILRRRFSFWIYCSILLPFVLGSKAANFEPDPPPSTLPMHTISLGNKEAFRAGSTNWRIAGGVKSNRHQAKDLHPVKRTGLIVNNPTSDHHKNLVTRMKLGDLELELDFLMPKGSNSGIYLQGRYEVQLLDSWGIEPVGSGDVGGIYQRWDSSRPKGDRGCSN